MSTNNRPGEFLVWLQRALPNLLDTHCDTDYRVLRMFADGCTIGEIAAAEGIKRRAVYDRLAALRKRLEVASNQELPAKAIDAGLIEPFRVK